MEQSWWDSVVEQWDSGTVIVEQWNSDGGTVMLEQCGGKVEQSWWNSVVEQ